MSSHSDDVYYRAHANTYNEYHYSDPHSDMNTPNSSTEYMYVFKSHLLRFITHLDGTDI